MLVVGLLGGALVCLLVLNTILAEDAIRLSDLQQGTALTVQRQQELEERIARAESPDELARRATALGMVPTADPAFVDPRTGRTYGRAGVVPPPAGRSGTGSPRLGSGRDGARDRSGGAGRTGDAERTGDQVDGGYSDPSGFTGGAGPVGISGER